MGRSDALGLARQADVVRSKKREREGKVVKLSRRDSNIEILKEGAVLMCTDGHQVSLEKSR